MGVYILEVYPTQARVIGTRFVSLVATLLATYIP